MKRCLNCRKTYEKELAECPYCGYKPRSKSAGKSTATTQEFEAVKDTKTYQKTKSEGKKNIYAASGYSGSFYLKGGERLNKRYSILSVMGFGAFGVAYECFDSFNQNNVVIKEYMPSYLVTRSSSGRDVEPLSDEAEVKFQIGVDAFVDESSKLADNDVSCVPKLIESFKQNNTSYVVTELVRGEALSSIIKRKGKLSYHATITIITGVLQGLRQFNKVGIIHGDICPDNIIVTSNSDVLLLDYNLSDFNKNVYTQRDSGKLRAGYSALEMYYMNMEQGPWTDVYAAAATMYKMLTGITVPSAIKRKTSDSLTSLSKLGVPITEGAEKAMFKALRVDYEKRTQNPEDFLNGLMGDGFDNISVQKESKTHSHSGTGASSTPSRPQSRQPKPKGHVANKILNGILIFLILTIFAVVVWLFISGIFTLPSAVMGLLENRGSDLIPDTTSMFSSQTESESDDGDNSYGGSFYDSTSSEEESENEGQEESQEESSEDTSSSIFDFNSIGSQINSMIDDYLSSEEEDYDDTVSYDEDENYDEGNGYYDEWGNYIEYGQTSSEEYQDETSSEQGFGEVINDFATGIRDRYF